MSLNRLSQIMSALVILGVLYLIVTDRTIPNTQKPIPEFGIPAENTGVFVGKVAWVTDGATLHLQGYGNPIRPWGIETPERGEQGYETAKQALVDMRKGQNLRCRAVERDRYGRFVAGCATDEGDTGRMLLDGGNAVEYCKYSRGFYERCRSNQDITGWVSA